MKVTDWKGVEMDIMSKKTQDKAQASAPNPLESGITQIALTAPETAVLASIAISLKRIADQLDSQSVYDATKTFGP